MSFSVNTSGDEIQRMYNRISDLLGPVAEPALGLLCEMVYEKGRADGEDDVRSNP